MFLSDIGDDQKYSYALTVLWAVGKSPAPAFVLEERAEEEKAALPFLLWMSAGRSLIIYKTPHMKRLWAILEEIQDVRAAPVRVQARVGADQLR